MSEAERGPGFITWPTLLDAGLTHVDILNRGYHDICEWIVRSADGHALVKIRLAFESQVWFIDCFVPAEHHPGASSTSVEWKLEETRRYLGGQVALMLDDVAAIVG